MDSKLKYVKLFESFVQKYEQIKKLPLEGAFNDMTDDKLICFIKSIENMNYQSLKTETPDINRPQVSVAWWLSMNLRKYSSYDTTIIPFERELHNTLLDFNDYFIPKHEFRGLNLKNKFGL